MASPRCPQSTDKTHFVLLVQKPPKAEALRAKLERSATEEDAKKRRIRAFETERTFVHGTKLDSNSISSPAFAETGEGRDPGVGEEERVRNASVLPRNFVQKVEDRRWPPQREQLPAQSSPRLMSGVK